MICRLCLNDASMVLNIFGDEGVQLEVAEIISKHFWFKPKSDDPISTVICIGCWSKLTDFNEFYRVVEEAHRLLTERFSLRLETNKSKTKENFEKNENKNSNTIYKSDNISLEPETDKDLVNEVSDDKTEDTLEKIDTEISLQDIETSIIPFDDENELTEYLSLEESERVNEDMLHISGSYNTSNESKRLTRSESKKSQNLQSPKSAKQYKRSLKNDVVKATTKRCSRSRKKPVTISNSTEPKLNVCEKKENVHDFPDKTNTKSLGVQKAKYQNIDERISKYLSLQCDICGEKETNFHELSKHMYDVHNFQRGYAICCDKKFYRRSLLFHHIEKHLNPDCFRCQECDKTFSDRQCLRNHIIVKHQSDEDKIYACNFCEKKFVKLYLLERHHRKHEERKHICEICEKGFATANLLKAHINVIHNNYGTMCEICAKVIRGRSAFARHVLEHQGVTLPKVQCPKCKAWYKDKHSLQKHIRRHNEEGTVHICNECGKVAPNRSALLAHKRYVHKEPVFECSICQKAFKNQIGLKEHMTIHTGETLYSCPHCPRTFNSNANMHSHRKKIHPKEFAEARLKRLETKIMKPMNDIGNKSQNQNTQMESEAQHHLMNDGDTLISSEKLSELVFKMT